ncbi:LysR family transcriptional regulator [Sagittula sp.]|uniref:LysR family transcriptional regulator n=1 Tax=Sagittula sp. TaxID=2038081 RepID=UPI003516C4B7
MQISLREFELFVATIELGTLTAAADALNISQPAASKMLRTFEERLGVELFRREKKKLVPTPDAYELFPDLAQVLRQVSAVKRQADMMKDRRSRQIEIVTNPAIASNIMPGAVAAFRSRFPDANVLLRTRTTVEVNDLLIKDQADLGVVYEASFDGRLSPETISQEEIGCLVHPDHPLAAQDVVTAADLEGLPLIALGTTQPVGAAFRRVMRSCRIEPRIAFEISQSNTAISFVAQNLGVAILDAMGLGEGRHRGLCALPMVPRATVRLSLVHAANRRRTKELQWMAQCIRTMANSSARKLGQTQPQGPSGPD